MVFYYFNSCYSNLAREWFQIAVNNTAIPFNFLYKVTYIRSILKWPFSDSHNFLSLQIHFIIILEKGQKCTTGIYLWSPGRLAWVNKPGKYWAAAVLAFCLYPYFYPFHRPRNLGCTEAVLFKLLWDNRTPMPSSYKLLPPRIGTWLGSCPGEHLIPGQNSGLSGPP